MNDLIFLYIIGFAISLSISSFSIQGLKDWISSILMCLFWPIWTIFVISTIFLAILVQMWENR